MIRRLKRAAKRNSYYPREARYPGVPYSSSWRRHNNPKPTLGFYARFYDAGRHRRRRDVPRPKGKRYRPPVVGQFLERVLLNACPPQ